MGLFKPAWRSLLVSLLLGSFLVLQIPGLNAAIGWASVEENVRRHIVRPGESLATIAQNYGFDVEELIQFNQLSNPGKLLAGQTIFIPGEQLEGGAPTKEPVKALDAKTFPPKESKPTEEEYFQLQQWMGGQADTPGIDSVDYNYSRNLPPAPAAQAGFAIPLEEGEVKPKSEKQEEAKKEPQSEEVDVLYEKDPEEEIADSASPALEAFGDRPYAYYGSGEELVEVLQNFAASYYLPTVISEDVLGEVNGKIGPLTPVDFLDHMANIYGFIWYFDGHSLYIYNGNAAQQEIISLGYMTTDKFKKTLKKVGIWDGRFFWKEQAKNGIIYISGPPRYVEMVTQTAALLDKKEGERQKSKLAVRMFRLKYAWATDKQFNFRGQQVTVPGVATLLKSIVKGGGVASVTRKDMPSPTLQPAKSVTRSGESAKKGGEVQPLNAGAEAEGVYINADPRLNAIIVHDLESKMPMYDELIQSLDKPTSQVEVSVSIIDVNTEDIEALGVDWNNQRPSGKSEIKFSESASLHSENLSSFTTVLEMHLGSFNARLKLLEDEGRAKVVSKPSILTLDNLEAVFDNSSTFYVSVASNEDAELFPVTSGTVVQVTPRIVSEIAGRRIHMSVNIQDGGDSQDKNLSLPRVSNSSISTQAVVNENESLLIGGFYKESENEQSTKVPVLGDIPVLGRMFRSERKQQSKQVRLFLITPRILSAGA